MSLRRYVLFLIGEKEENMRWIILALLLSGVPAGVASGQFTLSRNLVTSQKEDELEEMRNAAVDRGHWIGLRYGAQANGGDLGDRWFVVGMYEWRYSNTFSVPVEVHFFRHRGYVYNEFGQLHKVVETRPIVSIGLKARLRLWGRISPFFQGGLEYLSGSGFFLTTPNYAAGIEIFFSETIALNANVRKSLTPDYFHFVSMGFNANIVPFVR